MQLDVKDGLLAVEYTYSSEKDLAMECTYPSEKDLDELPRVWLTSNKEPLDPKILEVDESLTVPSFWGGESEFLIASNVDAQEQEELNKFGEYVLQSQHAV
eukprot:4989565-Ditylum_brightwellii.AAC.1